MRRLPLRLPSPRTVNRRFPGPRDGDGTNENNRLLPGRNNGASPPSSTSGGCADVAGGNKKLIACVIGGALCFILAVLVVMNTSTKAPHGAPGLFRVGINLVKSENDPRSYKYTALSNGLQALLISDPSASRAAAAVDVRVGYFSDPPHIAGLAHFLEHMLFMGTDKYPSETDFDNYLSANAGSSNAFTDGQSTNFHFE